MNALDLARKMETDAIQFYTEAAAKTKHAVGKKMFLSISEDEKRHLEMIAQVARGLSIGPRDLTPMQRVRTVFEEHKDEMMKKVAASKDEMEAFTIALRMEKEGEALYQQYLDAAKTDKEKDLFRRLIEEERQHYAIFSNSLQFLADTGNWFLWEERGIVEGG